MPVSLANPIRRLSQAEFGDLSYEVMRQVFAIHNEIGRFFDEKIYKLELAHRMPDVRLEEPIDVRFETFEKQYFIDLLVGGAGIFEIKAVDSLASRHQAQLLNYLLLCGVEHGKLINVRPEQVEHEFVNCHWEHRDRTRFAVDAARWNKNSPGAARVYDFLLAALRDLGTGLELELYDELVMHCFGGKDRVEKDVEVNIGGHRIGVQRFRLIARGVAFKVTAFEEQPTGNFETHAHRLLQHADLQAIAWVNISMKQVTFTTLEK